MEITMALIEVDSPFAVGRTDQKEIVSLQARADLMLIIRNLIDDNEWTQKEAAKILGTSQPRISDLKKGMVSKFSLGMLIEFLVKLGYEFGMTNTNTKITLKLECPRNNTAGSIIERKVVRKKTIAGKGHVRPKKNAPLKKTAAA